MGKRISGRAIANSIKEKLKNKISDLNTEIIFSIIYVGQDSVIDNFIKYKEHFGADIGVEVVVHNFDADVEQNILLSEIKNISKTADAMIVQLPLPKQFDTQSILDAIPVGKDVDVLSTDAIMSFENNDNIMFPPVTGAMVEVLQSEDYPLRDKKIVLVGYGNLVGKPFGAWLSRQNIDYDIVTKETSDELRKKLLKKADIIVSGAGVPHLIKANMLSENVVLLDGGTSESGKKLIGDIDPDCYNKSLFYTPVPGGIGPLTIAVLYQNILKTQNMI